MLSLPVPIYDTASCFATPIINGISLNVALSLRTFDGCNGNMSFCMIFEPPHGILHF